ncbi:hypothetical protein [Pantoea stewartii]|uniref:Transcriptional regulator n=1 Tax=Pantoea stewartii TaxID=66269 RepID=A0AB34VKV3_9GAMM|nr:hypothetical protein [Pantoea stewartii]KTS74277.1 hypothetical protein RSA30_06495 [Pantoea stewartii]KTT00982.1 hypothetical protein RSA13_00740 [Pantoea stewartii]KTT08499.1 hypothetical protein RSA36_05785 [Pantoea stewartii]
MNQITQYRLFIAAEVNRMLLEREMTVRYCSDEFNIKYKHQISTGECHPMTKDFVQRVRTGRFKVFTPRVAKLCDFLAIDQTLFAKQNIISDELGRKMQVIDCLIRDDLMLQKKVSRLLDDITELLRA